MKNLILFGLMLFSLQAISQKKAVIEEQEATIDTLTQQNTLLSAELDSIRALNDSLTTSLDAATKSLDFYYNTIKEKVLTHDFDPAALPEIIDSLRTSRDEKISGLSTASESLADSVTMLTTELATLKEAMAALENADADKEKLVAELKQLKELLDSGIFTEEEYEAKKAEIMAKW